MHITHANYESLRDRMFQRIHKTGEEIKNDLPNILRRVISTEAWKHFRDFEGKPFNNLFDWLHATFPNGPSMGQGQHALTYADALKLTEGATDVHRILEENSLKRNVGRPAGNGTSTSHLLEPRHNRSTAKTVLSVRLAQEKPKFYDAYLLGKYESVTAAATAAGLLKSDANLRRAKSAVRKMTAKERKDFELWYDAYKKGSR